MCACRRDLVAVIPVLFFFVVLFVVAIKQQYCRAVPKKWYKVQGYNYLLSIITNTYDALTPTVPFSGVWVPCFRPRIRTDELSSIVFDGVF